MCGTVSYHLMWRPHASSRSVLLYHFRQRKLKYPDDQSVRDADLDFKLVQFHLPEHVSMLTACSHMQLIVWCLCWFMRECFSFSSKWQFLCLCILQSLVKLSRNLFLPCHLFWQLAVILFGKPLMDLLGEEEVTFIIGRHYIWQPYKETSINFQTQLW